MFPGVGFCCFSLVGTILVEAVLEIVIAASKAVTMEEKEIKNQFSIFVLKTSLLKIIEVERADQ